MQRPERMIVVKLNALNSRAIEQCRRHRRYFYGPGPDTGGASLLSACNVSTARSDQSSLAKSKPHPKPSSIRCLVRAITSAGSSASVVRGRNREISRVAPLSVLDSATAGFEFSIHNLLIMLILYTLAHQNDCQCTRESPVDSATIRHCCRSLKTSLLWSPAISETTTTPAHARSGPSLTACNRHPPHHHHPAAAGIRCRRPDAARRPA